MTIKCYIYLLMWFCWLSTNALAQQDTVKTLNLEEIEIRNFRIQNPVTKLPSTHGLMVIGGRKSEVISLSGLATNLAEKTGRSLFAKIPSAFIYDMDGSENQINLSVRGLDGHRSWEFNVRQNGIMINRYLWLPCQPLFHAYGSGRADRADSWNRCIAVWSAIWRYAQLRAQKARSK